MEESSDKIPPSKRRFHSLLRCFGSSPKDQSQKAPTIGRRNRWIPSIIFRFKKSSATVSVDAAVPEITVRCLDQAYLPLEFKKPPPITSRAPAVGDKIVVDSGYKSIKPSQTRKKTESTQPNFTAERFPPAKRNAALLHSVSCPSHRLNRQKDLKKSVASHLPAAVATAVPPYSGRRKPARKPPTNSSAMNFDTVFVIIAVTIMVLWGRLCAILCTAALFYFRRRLRSEFELNCGGGGGGFGGIS